MARICREAGGRVRTNMMVRNMDVQAPLAGDSRRLEVVVDGLPVTSGAQVAVDTTLVCALHQDGAPRRGATDRNGVALQIARRRKEITCPEFFESGATSKHTWWSWRSRWERNKGIPQCIGDRARTQRNSSDEARRTGLADEMARYAGVHSGSRLLRPCWD